MKKIVFVNRYFYPDHSATSQILSDLVFSIADENYHIEIVASRQLYSDPTVKLPSCETIDDVKINRVWTSRFGRGNLIGRALDYLTFYISAFFFMVFNLSREDVVVAKTDPPLISIIAMLVSKIRGVRYINWLQDLFPEVALNLGVKGLSSVAPVLIYVRNKSLHNAVANVVISHSMKRHLLNNSVDESCIRIIHNWSINDEIKPVEQINNLLRTEWKLQDDFVVGYSGNMGRSHDFDTILGAAERLNHIENIKFLFVGAGAQLEYIKQKSSELELKNIILKPYQPIEMLKYSLTLPDLHVISLKPELEGLVVPSKFYGIIASGRPVLYIGDHTGDIATIIEQNACGRSYDIGDTEGVTAYIDQLRLDPSAICRMGNISRAIYEREFSKSVPHRQWTELINDIMESGDRH